MADDKDLERQYRKNLMVVASIVLIYSIAGGKMGSDLSMFGAKLIFSHPEYLEWAMMVLMCFFWWRHGIASKDIRREMISAVLNATKVPLYVQRACVEKIEREARAETEAAGLNINPSHNFTSNREFIVGAIGFIRVTVWVDYSKADNYVTEKFIINVLMNPLQFILVTARYRIGWLKHAALEMHFGDAILPSITWIIAVLAFLIHRYA